MPIATLTELANLALSHLGEPSLANVSTDTGTTANACRLHITQCQETVLEGHVWSFATKTVRLTPVDAFLPPTGDQGFYFTPGDYFQPPTPSEEDLPIISEFQSLFNLPSDCLRILKLTTGDIDVPLNRFEVQGRYLLLERPNEPATICHYITKNPSIADWPTTFTDAVSYLLASRLAPLLAQDAGLSGQMLQMHEMTLGKAKTKDSRETRSKENYGPRAAAARSGLVRARFNRHPFPPYA